MSAKPGEIRDAKSRAQYRTELVRALETMVDKLWRIDLTDRSRLSERSRPLSTPVRDAISEHSTPVGFPENGILNARPARRSAVGDHDKRRLPREQQMAAVAARRAWLQKAYSSSWHAAFSPMRSLIMSALMLYISGSDVHVFSVMAVVTVLVMHVQALTSTPEKFKMIVEKNSDLEGRVIPQMLVHMLACVVGIGGALYKCQLLGFLPTTESDWVALMPRQRLPAGPLGGLVTTDVGS